VKLPEENILVVTGHYGSGKTNFTLNLAKYLLAAGEAPVLCDLDIVNPYFRTGDYARELPCELIVPTFLGTTLDTPSLSAKIDAAILSGKRVILDAGGDDAGASALGRYAAKLRKAGYAMLYVVNKSRNLTGTPEEAAQILAEIEAASHLKGSFLVNNTNFGRETAPADLEQGVAYAARVSVLTGLPLLATCVLKGCESAAVPEPFPVEILVKFPWEGA
jgi:energy-coupling factor transporter ATP-binding protein EcfA2